MIIVRREVLFSMTHWNNFPLQTTVYIMSSFGCYTPWHIRSKTRNIKAAPFENVFSRRGHSKDPEKPTHPRHLINRCPRTESMDAVDYTDRQQKSWSDCARAQANLSHGCWNVLKRGKTRLENNVTELKRLSKPYIFMQISSNAKEVYDIHRFQTCRQWRRNFEYLMMLLIFQTI